MFLKVYKLIEKITISHEVSKDKVRPGHNIQVESLLTRNGDWLIHIFLDSYEDQHPITVIKKWEMVYWGEILKWCGDC